MNPGEANGVLMPPNGKTIAAAPSPLARNMQSPAAASNIEYTSGWENHQIGSYMRSLPHWIDDVTRDFGDDVYERMMNDSQVYSCVEILKMTVMANGTAPVPRISDPDHPHYAYAKYLADFCQRNCENLPVPFEQFLHEMMSGMTTGCKIAEKVFRFGTDGEDKGRLMLAALKVKRRRNLSFVVDTFNNVQGLLSIIPGRAFTLNIGSIYDMSRMPNVLPREKFCIFTFNPQDGDPRGHSVLRPAYDPWWSKLQLKGEFLKHMTQFGSPSVWGTLGPNAQSQMTSVDSNGNPVNATIVSPEQQMVWQLERLRNGSCAAFPNGSTLNVLQSGSAAAGFISAFDLYDKWITKAILSQTLATEEGQHQARAAAEVHADVLELQMANVRRQIAAMIETDIYYWLILYNFGEYAANHFTPRARVGQRVKDDWRANAAAVSSLVSCGFLDPSQYSAMDERLGLPARAETPQGMVAQNLANGMPADAKAQNSAATAAPSSSPQAAAAFSRNHRGIPFGRLRNGLVSPAEIKAAIGYIDRLVAEMAV